MTVNAVTSFGQEVAAMPELAFDFFPLLQSTCCFLSILMRGSKNCTVIWTRKSRWCVCVDNGVSREALTSRSLSLPTTPWQGKLVWRRVHVLCKVWTVPSVMVTFLWCQFTPPSHYLDRVMTVWLQQNRKLGSITLKSKETFSLDSLPTILCNSYSFLKHPALSMLSASLFLIILFYDGLLENFCSWFV